MSKLFFDRLLLGRFPLVRFKGWGPKHCDHPAMRERGHSKEEEKKSTGNLQKTSPDKLIVIKDKRESNMSGRIQNDTVTPVQCIVSGPIGRYISSRNSHPR